MGLIAIPIIACYLLRIQPRRYQVSTLMFWDKVIQDTKRRAWWQSLRRWLSLLLQLVFASLLIAAMIDPLFGRSEQARDVVLVIDRSASMNAAMDETTNSTETGQTRLDAALERAKSLAGSLRGGDTMAVIAAGGSVEVIAGRGDFGPTIVEAIESVRPTDGPGKLQEAIELARRIAPEPERRQVIVLTDQVAELNEKDAGVKEPRESNGSAETAAEKVAEKANEQDVFYETLGSSRGNWAITAMAVRRSLSDPVGFSTRITIQRFADADSDQDDSEVRLQLRLVGFGELDRASGASTESFLEPDGQLIDVLPIKVGDLDDDASITWTTKATSAAGGVLVAELDFGKSSTSVDAITADNTARAMVPPRPDVPVRLIAGPGSEPRLEDEVDSPEETSADAGLFFLRSVLQSIPTLKLIDEDAELPPGGLTVWFRPNEALTELPSGPLLVLSPQSDGPEVDGAPAWTVGETLESPIVAKTSESSALMRHVRMTNVTLGASRSLTAPENFGLIEPLVETATDDIVAMSIERMGDAAGDRILVLSTELGSSDFPLRIAFPVMMTNAVNWFTGRDAECPAPLRAGVAGETSVSGQPGFRLSGEQVAVTAFGQTVGEPLATIEEDQIAFSAIPRTGLAKVIDAGFVPAMDTETAIADVPGGWVAINLCDATESDTRIAESDREAAPVHFATGSSPWFYLVMAALGLIVTEWALFQRRIVE